MGGIRRGRQAYLLILVALAFVSNGLITTTTAETYRFTEERQRQLEEEKGRVHCSRSRSRLVRSIVSEYLMPFVESQKFTLSKSCRLHLENDLFREQEGKMEELRPMQWQCGYCKKVFRTQNYLDNHFDNRHSDKLDTKGTVCLADLCGALHCDYYDSMLSPKHKKTTCKPAVADRNRHACEVLANTCFPVDQSNAAHKLNDFFKRQFCDAHTCKRQLKIYPRGSGRNKNKSLFYAISLFTIVVLGIFYLVVFLHKRELSMLPKGLRRATRRPPIQKLQKST